MSKSINRQVDGKLAAIVIGIVSVVLPVYGLRDMDWENMEFSFLSALLPLLYVSAITGLIFLALGKEGQHITSKETDLKIAKAYWKIQKNLVPVWYVIAVAWLVWVGYLLWKLRTGA